jgi:hypothetical protein
MRRYTQTIRFSVHQSRRRSNQFSVFARRTQTSSVNYPLKCAGDCAAKKGTDCTRCCVHRQHRIIYGGQA